MELETRLITIQNRIAAAAQRTGRNSADVTLVGVSKYHSVPEMMAAYRAGLRHFGENRVEEIVAKVPDFLAQLPPDDLPAIHMIGHLQSRKVPQVLPHVQMIQSVDTIKLAQRLDRVIRRDGLPQMPILLECNISGEATKAGFPVAGWETDPAVLEKFSSAISTISALETLSIRGLMTMAPIVSSPEKTRPVFAGLRRLMAVCAERHPAVKWEHLSMGMTDDFEIAVEEGATIVRVGRAIFGARP